MKRQCSLHPVQLLPAGWSCICLWPWHRIKAGDKPPQLVSAPLPSSAWALTVWGRKMVKLAEVSGEAELFITSTWVEHLSQRKGVAPWDRWLLLVVAGCCRVQVRVCCTKLQQHRGVIAVWYSRAQVLIQRVEAVVSVLIDYYYSVDEMMGHYCYS